MTQYTLGDVDTYKQKRKNYEAFANRVAKILTEILNIEKVNYSIIESRGKTVESLNNRILESPNAEIDIDDLAGVRVVGYVKSDVDKIIEVIKNNFLIDDSKTKDKSAELTANEVGYRAIHLYGKLPDIRTILPEYKKFENMIVEFQVKTLLEHTWAVIEHDRNYKYKGLPDSIRRDLFLVAGNLESADKNFDQITKKIEALSIEVDDKLKLKKFDEIEIDPLSLKKFFNEITPKEIMFDQGYGFGGTGTKEVDELKKMGITNLGQLKSIVPNNLVKTVVSMDVPEDTNITKLVLVILTLKFREKYYDVVAETREYAKKAFETTMKGLLNAFNLK